MLPAARKAAYFAHALGYAARRRFSAGRQEAFIGGLVLNGICNLACRHCRPADGPAPDLSFRQAASGLRRLRRRGIRSLFIEGGEPFLWRDGNLGLEDVIREARKCGFYAVFVYTNGTFPLESRADTLFVSLDGVKEHNDALRGPVHDKVLANIAASGHPNLVVNSTINAVNAGGLERFCAEISGLPKVRGVFFNFHTPYYGRDELFLPLEERREAARRLLALKKSGARVLNSAAGLRAVIRDDWKRPSDLCLIYAGGWLYRCCRARGSGEVCADCGYLGGLELQAALDLSPGALLGALEYLPRL